MRHEASRMPRPYPRTHHPSPRTSHVKVLNEARALPSSATTAITEDTMRQGGVLRLAGLVISATLIHAAPASASDGDLDGRWIGGFANRNTVVVIGAQFSGAP